MSALDVRQEYLMDEEAVMVSRSDYQKLTGKSQSTMDRALREGRVPGAVKRKRGRVDEWWMPADAPVLDRAPDAVEVRQTPTSTAVTAPEVRPTYVAEVPTAFVDVRTAARLLGVPESAVREHVAELDGRQWGRASKDGRAWVIPLATIRRFAGL